MDVNASAAALRESGGHFSVSSFKGVDSSSSKFQFPVKPSTLERGGQQFDKVSVPRSPKTLVLTFGGLATWEGSQV